MNEIYTHWLNTAVNGVRAQVALREWLDGPTALEDGDE